MDSKKQERLWREAGYARASEFLREYGREKRNLDQDFVFRDVLPEEADQAASVERICFPPNEACSAEAMRARVAGVPELFLTAADKNTGKIAGFLNGIATEEEVFRDEFFKDVSLHNPAGRNVMLLGLDVLPEYRGRGLAREIVYRYLLREKERGRKTVILTCLEGKIGMYERMGFWNNGISGSSWGGEQWYDMSFVLEL